MWCSSSSSSSSLSSLWMMSLKVFFFVFVLVCGTGFFVVSARNVPTANLKYNEFVTHLTFDDYVEQTSDTLWVVEFYAPWCPHCQRFAPTFTEVATALHEKEPRLRVGVVNCVTTRDLCTLFGVKGYPTIKTVHQGHPVAMFSGAHRGKDDVLEWLGGQMAAYTGETGVPLHGSDASAREKPDAETGFRDGASSELFKDIVPQTPIRLADMASTLVFFLDTAPFLGVDVVNGVRLGALAQFLGAVADVVQPKVRTCASHALFFAVFACFGLLACGGASVGTHARVCDPTACENYHTCVSSTSCPCLWRVRHKKHVHHR